MFYLFEFFVVLNISIKIEIRIPIPPVIVSTTLTTKLQSESNYKINTTKIGDNNTANEKNTITVYYERKENTLRVTIACTKTMEKDSKCHWKLLYSTKKITLVVKQCMDNNDNGCKTPPNCKEFIIEGVQDQNEYILKVYLKMDHSIMGEIEIKPSIYTFLIIL